MAKKKPTKKELLKKLKKAKVGKDLSDYKKGKDSLFRKKAEKATFVVSSDLNPEVRSHTKKTKGKPGEIKAQKNRIKQLEKENRKIKQKRKDLENEYAFADDKRKKEIDKLLDKPDYQPKDLFQDKNLLRYLEGKDFYYVVDDGFKKYKISTKEFKKYWKKGQDVTLPILKRMKKENEETIKKFQKLIEKEKNTATKARMKKLKRILKGLEDKLEHTIEKNIEAIETGNMKVLDEINDEGEKAYSLLFKVVGFSIDRIGI